MELRALGAGSPGMYLPSVRAARPAQALIRQPLERAAVHSPRASEVSVRDVVEPPVITLPLPEQPPHAVSPQPQPPVDDAHTNPVRTPQPAPAETPELSWPEIARVISIVQRLVSPEDAARQDILLRTALSAAAKGYAASALSKAAELAREAPERAELLRWEPAFAPLRT